nr:unnamed protein product [Digitaria exilis]
MEDIHGIAIVGGGISGLATSLALHRKGIRSLVLEKSETLRAEGVAITIHANGWRALDSLGVGAELRELATLITTKDLIETLANSLPPGAIRFGCHIVAIDAADASSHGAQVLIGCDGANSVVAKFLGLSMPVQLPCLDILGLTRYPQGHPFGSEYLNILGKGYAFGQIPITENIVHFYVNMPNPSSTEATNKDAGRGKDYVLRKLQECQCPAEIVEKIRGIDPESMKILTKIWYMPPWRLVLGRFQRGTVTLAGDAMHVMGPFNGQGGSVALEDAVVLARSLSMAVPAGGGVDAAAMVTDNHGMEEEVIRAAIGRYVRERRPRVAKLSLECFVIGTLLGTKSLVKRLICVAVLAVLGNMSGFKANYDCGPL